MDANGDDAKTDDSQPGLLLLPMTTTQEVTYIDDEDIGADDGTPLLIDRDPFRWNEIVKV